MTFQPGDRVMYEPWRFTGVVIDTFTRNDGDWVRVRDDKNEWAEPTFRPENLTLLAAEEPGP